MDRDSNGKAEVRNIYERWNVDQMFLMLRAVGRLNDHHVQTGWPEHEVPRLPIRLPAPVPLFRHWQ